MRKMFYPLINWIYHVVIFIILFSSQKETEYFDDKINDFIFMGSIILISGIISFIPKFYRRPLKLAVTQCNKVTKKPNCEYVQNDTGVDSRTIELHIRSIRKPGWNKILHWYLKKKEVYILIECNPKDIHLQAKEELLKPDEIIPLIDGSGFYINISSYLIQVTRHSDDGELSKKVQFFIKDPREVKTHYLSDDTSVYINPELIVNEKNAKYLELMLNWSPESYKIEYYRK